MKRQKQAHGTARRTHLKATAQNKSRRTFAIIWMRSICPSLIGMSGRNGLYVFYFISIYYSLSSCTVKWRMSGASHAILTPRVISALRS